MHACLEHPVVFGYSGVGRPCALIEDLTLPAKASRVVYLCNVLPTRTRWIVIISRLVIEIIRVGQGETMDSRTPHFSGKEAFGAGFHASVRSFPPLWWVHEPWVRKSNGGTLTNEDTAKAEESFHSSHGPRISDTKAEEKRGKHRHRCSYRAWNIRAWPLSTLAALEPSIQVSTDDGSIRYG